MNDSNSLRARLAGGAAFASLFMLAACGGGGGVNSTPAPRPTPAPAPAPTPAPSPTPSPTPAPSPTPTPTPSPSPTPSPTPAPAPAPTPTPTISYSVPPEPVIDLIGYKDQEYSRSDGPAFHGAPNAWVAGATGAGRTIAIVDTGVLAGEPELAGRISPDSTGVNGNTGYEPDPAGGDDSLHGTEVAMIAAAANDGAGTVGIAYDATIMAIRAEDPGTCSDGCTFGNVAAGMDWAIDHGATVINLSLGGSGATGSEIAAVKRAADAGIVVVVAAGNDGNANPDVFAKALAGNGNGNVIIVGSVSRSGNISSFSNKAGTHSKYYLAALGQSLTIYETSSIYDNPGIYQISGTSFAAPQVAGAVALLKQAFPQLTASQLVARLLDSAQDVGVAGVDTTYGHGILDIYRAFQPLGTTSVPGSKEAMRIGDDTGATSQAMGDALAGGLSLETFVLDRDKIAFPTDLGVGLRTARQAQRLQGAVGQQQRFVSIDAGKAAVAFTLDTSQDAERPWPRQLMLSREQAEGARVLAARVAMNLSPKTAFGFAYSESADGLVGQMQGQERPAFLIARSATGDDGLFRTTDAAVAMRHKLGNWGLTVSAESGGIVSGAPLLLAEDAERRSRHDAVRSFALAADRRWGPLEASLGLTVMDEAKTVLGARFHDGLGAGGAQTYFLDAHAGWSFADGWRLGGAVRQGVTFADTVGLIASGSRFQSRSWSADLRRSGVFGERDSLAFRVAQPLRVESGGLAINLPVAFSYETLEATYATRTLSLSPQGRELMSEIAWRGPLFGGFGSASMFYRREPGHYAAAPDDKGVALRWDTTF